MKKDYQGKSLSHAAEIFDFNAWHQMASSAFHVRLWKKSWFSSAPSSKFYNPNQKKPCSSSNTQSWETCKMHAFFWWYGIFAHPHHFSFFFWWEPRHLFVNLKKKKIEANRLPSSLFQFFSDENQDIYFSWPHGLWLQWLGTVKGNNMECTRSHLVSGRKIKHFSNMRHGNTMFSFSFLTL